MKDSQPFDHRPDPELGVALRAALEPKDDQSAFVARIWRHGSGRASLRRPPRSSPDSCSGAPC
jgi:hypothetical protein